MNERTSSPRAPDAWDLRLYFAVRFCTNLAMQVQSVAVGWQVYDLTHDPLTLGYVGLAQFLPMVLLVLPAGDLTDRADRRFVLLASQLIQMTAAAGLLALTLTGTHVIWLFYIAVALFGVARGISSPAILSFLPFLVTSERLPRAVAIGSSVAQIATVSGPALGGVLYLLGPAVSYGVAAELFLAGGVAIALVHIRKMAKRAVTAGAFERVREGIRYVARKPVLLGAISLDLFAVLFGGAVALLPVYARDILHVGPDGLGLLRSAPALGAAVMAIALSRWPLKRRLGPLMFVSVAVFGLATIVFGVSTSFLLSFAALVLTGVSDQVSVVIRLTLVQLATHDHMQGRVNAVNSLFIGTSNELGEFESGATARLFGTVPAVVIGGLGTLAVVAAWMALFPPLRKINRFAEVMPVADEESERL